MTLKIQIIQYAKYALPALLMIHNMLYSTKHMHMQNMQDIFNFWREKIICENNAACK
jgi:hypothetical protein